MCGGGLGGRRGRGGEEFVTSDPQPSGGTPKENQKEAKRMTLLTLTWQAHGGEGRPVDPAWDDPSPGQHGVSVTPRAPHSLPGYLSNSKGVSVSPRASQLLKGRLSNSKGVSVTPRASQSLQGHRK
ncbi:hypothetical protein Pmani_037167 [Petrolisthes manimaculis]|uniref:Uncharacterized protein n=1 Tax=Petrolisthes manimaculis TaxID=1843537 RepID=A0AAE1TLR7_9EUCA|nr:hypothetical protein Pmani_037167 [Petrolisthes manimaculis]